MSKSPSDLKTLTLINRVMSGKKEYRTNNYLKAFGNISASDLHSNDVSRTEMIKLWNSLQNSPGRTPYFTFALHRDGSFVAHKVEEYYANEKWAWIIHDKDGGTDRKHYHFVLIFNSPRSFRAIANDLEIPVTMLQKVYSKKGILNYLTHENDPNKHHYSTEEIHANFDVNEEKKDGDDTPDVLQEFQDFWALKNGEMAYTEWLNKYNHQICNVRHFGSRLQIYERMSFSSGASLSSRTDNRMPYPRNKKLFQTEFSKINPNKVDWIDDGAFYHIASDPFKPSKKRSYAKPNPRSDLNDID